MCRRIISKIAVFSEFCKFFGLHLVSPTVKKDLKKENKKNGDGNVFQNLIKPVDTLFGKKFNNLFLKLRTQKNCLIQVSFCIKKGL